MAAGAAHGIVDFGIHALNAMRLEKGIGIWSREFSRDYTSAESGLDRFVALDKGEFIGRAAAQAERESGPPRRLVSLAVEAADADAPSYEPIWRDGESVGFVTSGGYGHRVGHSIALGYVGSAALTGGGAFEVSVLGERRPARLLSEPAYDPAGERARA
jgi:dimethylglycine dehydrogenase